jgi:hypothetical protein
MKAERTIKSLKEKIDLFSKPENNLFCYILYKEIEVTEATSAENNEDYFADIKYEFLNTRWSPIKYSESFNEPCFYIIESHGSDISQLILRLESIAHKDSIISLWHFDNHIAYFENFKSAISSDINFITHNSGVPGYLTNSHSLIAEHIPACTLQFSKASIITGRNANLAHERVSKALFNYVDYPNSPRAWILEELQKEVSDIADFLIMPSSDRSRYWKKPLEERYAEWAQYKCTVIVPLVEDLSTRVFDSLATGLIPIIPKNVRDIDSAIHPEVQEQLGIVIIDDLSPENVRNGIEKAILNFNKMGVDGIVKRTDYVINNALISHRVKSMTSFIDRVACDNITITYGSGPSGIGIYATTNQKG